VKGVADRCTSKNPQAFRYLDRLNCDCGTLGEACTAVLHGSFSRNTHATANFSQAELCPFAGWIFVRHRR
jgi:hypothetical protein